MTCVKKNLLHQEKCIINSSILFRVFLLNLLCFVSVVTKSCWETYETFWISCSWNHTFLIDLSSSSKYICWTHDSICSLYFDTGEWSLPNFDISIWSKSSFISLSFVAIVRLHFIQRKLILLLIVMTCVQKTFFNLSWRSSVIHLYLKNSVLIRFGWSPWALFPSFLSDWIVS